MSGWKLTVHGKGKSIPDIPDNLNSLWYFQNKDNMITSPDGFAYFLNDLYVLKRIYNHSGNHNTPQEKSFKSEVAIGSLPDIGKVGARLFVYRTVPETNDHAQYFDLLMENIGRDVIPIKDVEITPKIVKKVWETILDFYRITKGSHGDLHGENMYLTSTGEVKIIDYGMYRPFINPRDSLFLRNYMNKKVFENSNIAYEPENQKIPGELLNALLQYNNNHRSKIRNWWHTIQKNA